MCQYNSLINSVFYPFGMPMSGRNANSGDYRYAFNGMEKDDEIKGSGNSYTTEFRQLDPRLGRWLSLDPLMAKYPHQSPYVAFNNDPILFVDPDGLEGQDWVKGIKGKNTWTWDSNINSAEQAEAAGATDYASGTEGRTITGTKDGVYGEITLGENGESTITPIEREEEVVISSFLWNNYSFTSDYGSRPILNTRSEGYTFSDPQAVRDAWGSKAGWDAVIQSAKVVSVGSVVLPTAFIAGPTLANSNFFGIESGLTAKTIGIKMGVSATYQGVMNEGEINLFATGLDGFVAPGTSVLVGNLWNPSINIVTGERKNEYLGSGISLDQYVFRASTGLLFGGKQTGLEKLGGKSASPFIQFSSGMWTQGLNKVFDERK